MPRLARLDAPGLLNHVMARGIERRDIFKDDKDRKAFLERLATVLEETQETQTQCYAWALIPNHFHLLLRTSLPASPESASDGQWRAGAGPLSKVMRRLMTGYAVTFNKRHKRSGHLFQNRYKSVVCEEDPYLLELIRYIHLNPLRAGLVKDLRELDRYPWSGHSAILGRRKNQLIQYKPPDSGKRSDDTKNKSAIRNLKSEISLAEKTIQDLLLIFGSKKGGARRRYRQFVKEGVDQGSRPELQGGGLVRSAGGDKRGLLGRKKDERELSDERILGSGDFVNEALMKAGKVREKRQGYKISLPELVEKIASHLDLKTERIISASRRKEISEARALVCYFAINNLSYSASEVARSLAISRVNAGRCAERAKKVLDNYEDLKDIVQ